MSSAFFDAIKHGKMDEARRMLAATPGLIHEKENELSPIMVAAYHGEMELADFLADKTGNLTIFECAATGRINQTALLLARDPLLVNAYAEDGFQPLGLACYFGHHQMAEFLIKAGAAVNSPARNGLGAAPLHSAAAAGQLKLVNLLLDNDADPNTREQNGSTPLHIAAENGNSEIIRALLFNGATLTIRNQDEKLPIDLATAAGHHEAAKLLKEGITRRFRAKRARA